MAKRKWRVKIKMQLRFFSLGDHRGYFPASIACCQAFTSLPGFSGLVVVCGLGFARLLSWAPATTMFEVKSKFGY
jgi:hypothetical protein